MSRMRLFAHRRFLRLLATFLRPFVRLAPEEGKILGFNLVVTGKISVTGNAMSRTMRVRHGKAGTNNLRYHALSAFALIRTRTGCLGLNLTFFLARGRPRAASRPRTPVVRPPPPPLRLLVSHGVSLLSLLW